MRKTVLVGSTINGHTKISYLYTLSRAGKMKTPESIALDNMARLLRESAERQEKEAHGLRSIATQLQIRAETKERELESEICNRI